MFIHTVHEVRTLQAPTLAPDCTPQAHASAGGHSGGARARPHTLRHACTAGGARAPEERAPGSARRGRACTEPSRRSRYARAGQRPEE